MIQLQNISKTFRIAKRQAGLGRAVKALFSRDYETVHALRDVSFTIGPGEMVGYIGRMGPVRVLPSRSCVGSSRQAAVLA